VHADHITASGEIRKRTGAKIGLSSAYASTCPDLKLDEQSKISFGPYVINVLNTPGHTRGCLTYQVNNMLFTGDVLLVRGCGRTDFQEGSSEALFESVRNKIFKLPDTMTVYPAHDYHGYTHTTLGEEKKFNPRLNLNIVKNEFVSIMANLKLSFPKKIQEAVPANLNCGLGST
jgi:sulfur dioxygenase